MSEQIKAKAQEIRLALLEEAKKQIDHVAAAPVEDRSHMLADLASILNQLDPTAHGLGSYLAADRIAPEDLGGVGGYNTK